MSFELQSPGGPAAIGRPFETLNTTTHLQNTQKLNNNSLIPSEYKQRHTSSGYVNKNMSARDGGFNYVDTNNSAHQISESVHSTPQSSKASFAIVEMPLKTEK